VARCRLCGLRFAWRIHGPGGREIEKSDEALARLRAPPWRRSAGAGSAREEIDRVSPFLNVSKLARTPGSTDTLASKLRRKSPFTKPETRPSESAEPV